MIQRSALHNNIRMALGRSRIVALLGPRQSGKTTLARQFVSIESANYFDLEDPVSLARLDEPYTALSILKGLVVIDEVQRQPSLFPILRVLADRPDQQATFLISGSASPDLLKQSSESLAGRMEIVEVSGFSCHELVESSAESAENLINRHWLRGGYPLAFLAADDDNSYIWRREFIRAVIERDIPQLSGVSTVAMQRFWAMLSHYHGQVWNAADMARSMSVSEATARRYLDLLSGVFMIRQLQPWHENIKKRQVKSPKIYFRDCGLLHQLLNIRKLDQLLQHPALGASWEGYVIEELINTLKPDQAWFWATHASAELDLLLMLDGRRIGFEIKRADAPKLTQSMRTACEDLQLDHLYVLYPGSREYPLSRQVTVKPFHQLITAQPTQIPS
jgi:predicted AAA+ superfamily ATPase